MKYRRLKKIVTNRIFVLILAISLFLAVFFIFHKIRPSKAPAPGLEGRIEKQFSFSDDNSLKEWEEKVFKNRVAYKIEQGGDLSYVRASSNNAASAMYYRIKLDTRSARPFLAWKWRVEKFPAKTGPDRLDVENEDDFAARVFVIFPAMFITNWKVVEYVWSENLPVGTTGTSPYSKNIKLIVVRRGTDPDKKWFTEERDIYDDYVKLFGRRPEYNVGAIAFMTNTEHTGTSADAMYDDIIAGYRK